MADALTNNAASPFSLQSYIPTFKPPSSTPTPFRLDEGYSEETRSQSEGDAVMRTDSRMGDGSEQEGEQVLLPDWVKGLSEAERSEFAYAILRSLRTSSIAAIVDRLTPLLHIDPVQYLPSEIIFEILSHLDVQTLLKASTLSRTWRNRALDGRLWRRLFGSEGWAPNTRQVRSFEEAERARFINRRERSIRSRSAPMDVERQKGKKRARTPPLFGDATQDTNMSTPGDQAESGPHGWGEQHGTVEADEMPEAHRSHSEDRMQDVSYHDSLSPAISSLRAEARAKLWQSNRSSVSPEESSGESRTNSPQVSNQLVPPIEPRLVDSTLGHEPKINWQYLYKQKRRLEENWTAGRFTNFQLPHPNHMYEAHTECVYTIQYSGPYLVSGSRDQTVRMWDLDTQRLIRPPLRGHTASVLCLQFDERPDQDIIVSGGSDCQVIIWRFSTGQIIKRLPQAHSESVLNLRFDNRYLVTCSKDKTIKVWNLKELSPTDAAYPTSTTSGGKFPSYIVNLQDQFSQHLHRPPLERYSLLMTLYGHTAAVNAIQILGGQIISASGDRSLKVWDVHTGACLRTIPGHTKGIACVEFDGRRIVSGSSDETVRIFDRVTGLEVACLRGHTVLVRTVQARFGDSQGNEDELEAEARDVDRQFFQAVLRGDIPAEPTREQRHVRNAGSRNPMDIIGFGGKLPPGGGGSRWGRIVSGSYDETIIIWKRDSTGKWVVAHRLYQWEAVQNAGGTPRGLALLGATRRAGQQTQGHPGAANQQPQQQAAQQGVAAPAAPQAPAQSTILPQHQLPQLPGGLAALAQQIAQAQVPGQPPPSQAQIQQILDQHNAGSSSTPGSDNTTTPPPQQSPPAQPGQNPQPPQPPQQATHPPPSHHHHWHAHHHHHHHHHHAQAHAQAHAHALAHGQQPPAPMQAVQGMNSRVFKLQFDARRIICCSQDPTIVGWDFANGDEDIIAASRFFGDEV